MNNLHEKITAALGVPRFLREDVEQIAPDDQFYTDTLASLNTLASGTFIKYLNRGNGNIKMGVEFENITIAFDYKNGVFLSANSVKVGNDNMEKLYKMVAFLNGQFKNSAVQYLQ
jgi:hypothetical protein